jgi:hypothetical protein
MLFACVKKLALPSVIATAIAKITISFKLSFVIRAASSLAA